MQDLTGLTFIGMRVEIKSQYFYQTIVSFSSENPEAKSGIVICESPMSNFHVGLRIAHESKEHIGSGVVSGFAGDGVYRMILDSGFTHGVDGLSGQEEAGIDDQ